MEEGKRLAACEDQAHMAKMKEVHILLHVLQLNQLARGETRKYLRGSYEYYFHRKNWRRINRSTTGMIRDAIKRNKEWLTQSKRPYLPEEFWPRHYRDWLYRRKKDKRANTYQVLKTTLQIAHGDDT